MPLFKKILIVYALMAAAMLFKLEMHPRNLLFVAQPLIIALMYWNKVLNFKVQNIHTVAILAFLMIYGLNLIPKIYDLLRYNETVVSKGIGLNTIFIFALVISFYKGKRVKLNETE